MANNTNPATSPLPGLPIFYDQGYEHWSIKMKTLFRFQDLWDFVEQGIAEDEKEGRQKGSKKKDAKALFIIQQSHHPNMFSRIAVVNTAKEAWCTLKVEFQGNPKIMTVKIHEKYGPPNAYVDVLTS